jgi:hypothetical protein
MKFGVLLVVALMVAACGSSSGTTKIGEACSNAGKTDECVDGAVCTKDMSSATKCLKICTGQADCAAVEECNGVEGSSLKACRIKK